MGAQEPHRSPLGPRGECQGRSGDRTREWWKGIKAPGTELPGVIKVGTFYQWRERVFWDVRDPDKTIVIELGDERYARLVIEVEAPPTTVAAIKQALGGLRG